MSRPSSSEAENILGMMFSAICFAAIVLYRLYKNAKANHSGAQHHD